MIANNTGAQMPAPYTPRPFAANALQDAFYEQRECEVIVTHDREYFVAGGICFAERDRLSGRCFERRAWVGVAQAEAPSTHDEEREAQNASWIPPASQAPAVAVLTIATPLERTPRAGEWLCLQHSGALHCTGPVLSVERRIARAFR